ncbi:fatty acid synthase-like [Acanthaster planci]|uniref:Fatty acid synthase-like n=1 Tax=Acanthaster planci TaxID=133434 RepID=A0A8B7ZQ02_ACAPL|nr:fatty acid synthase-like [Acanthaster planci]
MGRDQPSDIIAQEVKAVSRTGNGVNLVMDFAGLTKTFEIGLMSLDLNGQYIAIGLFGGEAQIPLPNLVLANITLKGIAIGSLDQLKRLVELVLKKPSIYDNLKCTVYPLEDGIQVLETLAEGKMVGRAVLKCNNDDEKPLANFTSN